MDPAAEHRQQLRSVSAWAGGGEHGVPRGLYGWSRGCRFGGGSRCVPRAPGVGSRGPGFAGEPVGPGRGPGRLGLAGSTPALPVGFGGSRPAPPGVTHACSPAAGLPAGLQPYDRALLPPLCLQPQLPAAHGPRGVVSGQLRREAGPRQPPPDGRLRGTGAGNAAAPRSRVRDSSWAIRTPSLF